MTLADVLAEHNVDLDTDWGRALHTRLMEREDGIADQLRLGGVQFGLFPEIVAEVLATVGLGSPLDDATRMVVRGQYVALMERLRREHGQGN